MKRFFQRLHFSVWVLAALALALLLVLVLPERVPPPPADGSFDVRAHYQKHEYRIPMRDGVRLHTTVYVPRDRREAYPFLVKRTPYSSAPYGPDAYADHIGPTGTPRFAEEGYIIVYQDVRGRFMSEGTFLHVTPACPAAAPPTCVDESTDMYDTVEWLLANVEGHNGRVGLWGISYPGFYAAASIVNTHPAIKASSPQAPVGDWFLGDDFHHNGAFFLQDAFNFFTWFESPGPNPTDSWGARFDYPTPDAYQFFLSLGPLKNANTQFLRHEVAFWDSLMQHPNYGAFWQRRHILPHLRNITTPVMTVAGFFDAEDPYGPIQIYDAIETQNPGLDNTLVLGPWFHGGWVRSDGDRLGNVSFTHKTAQFYQDNVDLPFFNYHLKGKGTLDLPEVLAYATGSDTWHELATWPPPNRMPTRFYLAPDGRLQQTPASGQTSYRSDPHKPVPYTAEHRIDRTREYMVEDQRFAARRPDVLVFQTDPLAEDWTLAGPITAHLQFLTDATDLDLVVKVIDVFPGEAEEPFPPEEKYLDVPMGGYQMLVRGEVFRARYRNSFEHPAPISPGVPTEIRFEMPDIFHTFRAGHRLMVQVQSSWFPLVDRNPQQFVNIYEADAADFRPATVTILHNRAYPSHIEVGRLE